MENVNACPKLFFLIENKHVQISLVCKTVKRFHNTLESSKEVLQKYKLFFQCPVIIKGASQLPSKVKIQVVHVLS